MCFGRDRRLRAASSASQPGVERDAGLDRRLIAADHPGEVQDYELIAQEVSSLGPRIHELEERLAVLAEQIADVQKVNARLEAAALNTARSLGQIATHWDAVYEAMRRDEIYAEGERDDDMRDGD